MEKICKEIYLQSIFILGCFRIFILKVFFPYCIVYKLVVYRVLEYSLLKLLHFCLGCNTIPLDWIQCQSFKLYLVISKFCQCYIICTQYPLLYCISDILAFPSTQNSTYDSCSFCTIWGLGSVKTIFEPSAATRRPLAN